MISIIIPTYNEAESVPELLSRIHNMVKRFSYEVIIVDDSSSDETGKVALNQAMYYHYPVKLVSRPYKQGLATAVVRGCKEATGNIIVVMDADLQHDTATLDRLLAETLTNDIVIASRYVDTGKIERWSIKRQITSDGARTLAKILFPKIKNISDPMSGFFAFNRKVIDGVKLRPRGFKILLEILVRGKYNSVKEIPFTFQKRKYGKSNLNFKEYLNYLHHLFRLTKDTELSSMIKFAIVGLSGILVNEGMLYLLVEHAKVYMYVSLIVAIQLSIVSNFMFNSIWTFKNNKISNSLIKRFTKFEIVCITGAMINIVMFVVFSNTLSIHYLEANLLAIMIAFLFNYFGSRNFIWR